MYSITSTPPIRVESWMPSKLTSARGIAQRVGIDDAAPRQPRTRASSMNGACITSPSDVVSVRMMKGAISTASTRPQK